MQKVFSYPVQTDKLSAGEKHFKLVADEEQCLWIAEIFKVLAVKSFSAEINLKPDFKNHAIRVWGRAKAELEQMSVISLEPFVKKYETDFEVLYDTKATYTQIKEEYDDINEDAPKLIENGEIDLAAEAMEEIALIIDDYPRKEGETFSFEPEFDETEDVKKHNPFDVLKKIKK